MDEILKQTRQPEYANGIMLTEGVERCPIPIFVLDRTHSVTHWNKALETLSGIPAGTMLGSHAQWRAFTRSSGQRLPI